MLKMRLQPGLCPTPLGELTALLHDNGIGRPLHDDEGDAGKGSIGEGREGK